MALKRKGSEEALQQLLPAVKTKKEIASTSDRQFLAHMTKCIFRSGFVWRVVEIKWPGFEEAFYQFDPKKLCHLPIETWDAYSKDTRIIRNMTKIMTIPKNAEFVQAVSETHAGFGKFIAEWPEGDTIGLLAYLKQKGKRLGGMTGQWFLRLSGKDCFVFTKDVILCLQNAGLDVKDMPTSKREYKLIQETFNNWHHQTNMPYTHLSRICAYSVGVNRVDLPGLNT